MPFGWAVVPDPPEERLRPTPIYEKQTMLSLQEQYESFRFRFPVFIYRSFEYAFGDEQFSIRYHFCLQDRDGNEPHHFRPVLRFDLPPGFSPHGLPEDLLQTLVFHCGMIELVSYWKCCCSPLVRIECAELAPEQTEWFKKLYYNGLGEFFYLNGIKADRRNFMQMEYGRDEAGKTNRNSGTFQNPQDCESLLGDGILVPVGGGKDSVVSLEILKQCFPDRIRPMIINPRGATTNCCIQAGFPLSQCATVSRTIDSELLRLNDLGFLNGHTPFSAMLAFTSLLSSVLNRSRHIALSNENSANESTVLGSGVNHQYSKSLEFENDFRQYVARHISPAFNYFSFLRPLSELGIARLFSSYPLYHSIFRSCNAGSKTDSWCGKCPKCLFAFIILCPFMGIEKTSRLFGKDLLDDPDLEPFLEQLCGLHDAKPFECVGTVNEVNWALQQLRSESSRHRLLSRYFEFPCSRIPVPDSLLEEFSPDHNLDPSFGRALKSRIEEVRKWQTAGHRIRVPLTADIAGRFLPFFEHPGTIAILGLGREGKSSFRLIRDLLPEKDLLLVDADPEKENDPLWKTQKHIRFITGPGYLETFRTEAGSASLILKTPGISLKDFPDLLSLPQLSSQTDLFLRIYGRQAIGITGTKGKSTTSMLCHHLIDAYRPCLLAGNIGIPLFDIVDEIGSQTLIVCEFSAHQLEQAHTAPHTGVLLNLYEEHLDHYRSFLDYQQAKMNIAGQIRGNDETRCSGKEPALSRRITENAGLPSLPAAFIYHKDDPLIRERLRERFGENSVQPPRPSCTGNDQTETRTAIPTVFLCYSAKNEADLYLRDNSIITRQGEKIFDLSDPHPLIGRHNLSNLMAALLAAHANGISYRDAVRRIASFRPLPHRLQLVGCIDGSYFFNDSISTIPQATVAALESVSELPFVKGIDCLILGGMDRGIDYQALADYLKLHKLENITFVGDAGKRIFRLLRKSGAMPANFLISDDYPQIVQWAKEHTRPGFACILSPAAASYDQFRNFAHRGEVFSSLVRSCPAKNKT